MCGAVRPRAFFVTELADALHVEVRRVAEGCVADAVVARFDRPGAPFAFIGLTHSERGAGQALIVTVGGSPPVLAAHAYDGGRPVFSAPIRHGQRATGGRSVGDVWYPVVLLDEFGEQAAAFVWAGETLAPAPAPTPTP